MPDLPDKDPLPDEPTSDEDVSRQLDDAAEKAARRHDDEQERRARQESAERAGENPRRDAG